MIIIILKPKRITTNNNKAMEVGVMVSIEGFHNQRFRSRSPNKEHCIMSL